MKKLMIALSAVALTTVAGAATANWNFNLGSTAFKDGYVKNYSPAGTAAAFGGATLYLFSSGMTYGDKTGQQALINAVMAGETWTDYALKSRVDDGAGGYNYGDAISATTSSESGTNKGKIALADGTKFQYDVATPGTDSLSVFAAMLVKGTDGKDYLYLSATKDTTSSSNPSYNQSVIPAVTTAGSFREGTEFGSGGWYNVTAVPEPTSAMLVLLGVAGLALKRKRA